MAEIYNLTNISSSSNMVELTQHANNLTGGLYGVMIVVSFFIVVFAAQRTSSMPVRATGASFISTIVAILLRIIDITTDRLIIIMFVITASSFLFLYFHNKKAV